MKLINRLSTDDTSAAVDTKEELIEESEIETISPSLETMLNKESASPDFQKKRKTFMLHQSNLFLLLSTLAFFLVIIYIFVFYFYQGGVK